MSSFKGASADAETGSRASHRANSSVVSTKGFDPAREHTLVEMIASYLHSQHGNQWTGIGTFKDDARVILSMIQEQSQ